jgi:hypothetical protein
MEFIIVGFVVWLFWNLIQWVLNSRQENNNAPKYQSSTSIRKSYDSSLNDNRSSSNSNTQLIVPASSNRKEVKTGELVREVEEKPAQRQ